MSSLRHTRSSQLYRQEAGMIPAHKMHILARTKTCLYYQSRYQSSAYRHKRLVARAMEHMDEQLWRENHDAA